jgi:hypothetical protein
MSTQWNLSLLALDDGYFTVAALRIWRQRCCPLRCKTL